MLECYHSFGLYPLLVSSILILMGLSASTARSDESQKGTLPEPQYQNQAQEKKHNWWSDAVFYEIWPRSFKDTSGDGVGDFKGITDQLDYVVKLGAKAIWLTPVFEAPSYHGYDFQKLREVESDYGTMQDLENLLAQSKKRGLRVVVDLVLNHISAENEWFVKSAKKDPKYDSFFVWRKKLPTDWKKPWGEGTAHDVWHFHPDRKEYFYAVFGPEQPDLNFENQAVQNEIFSLADFWLKKGFDGFRLDAARYLFEAGAFPDQADTPKTIAFWKKFRNHVKKTNPDAILIGEVWAPPETIAKYYGQGDVLDLCFDFDFGHTLIRQLAGKAAEEGIFGRAGLNDAQQSDARSIADQIFASIERKRNNHVPLEFYAPFLTNHDQVRIMTELSGNLEKMKLAAALLLTMPGTPFIYYGEELGLTQDKLGDDVYKRAPMPWNDAPNAGFTQNKESWVDNPKWTPWIKNFSPWWQRPKTRTHATMTVEWQTDPKNSSTSLFAFYQKLIAIRSQNKAFNGTVQRVKTPAQASKAVIAYVREEAEASQTAKNSSKLPPARVTVLLNTSSKNQEFDAAELFVNTASLVKAEKSSRAFAQDLLSGQNVSLKGQKVTLQPYQILILQTN